MQMIGSLAVRIRFLAAAIALVMLTCGTRSKAWCASQNLWFSSYSSGVESYTTGQLKKSGMPTPIQLSTFSDASGLAFDKSHNLWVVVYDGGSEVVQFTPAQLKNLKNDPSPTPAVVIRSTSTFSDIIGCNLPACWLTDLRCAFFRLLASNCSPRHQVSAGSVKPQCKRVRGIHGDRLSASINRQTTRGGMLPNIPSITHAESCARPQSPQCFSDKL